MSTPSDPAQGLDLVGVAELVLARITAHYDAAGATLPERRYIAAGGEVPWDCPQVTVGLQGIGWGPAQSVGQQAIRAGSPVGATALRHAMLIVGIVRCAPLGEDGDPPAVLDLDDAGRAYLRDAGLLSQALVLAAAQVQQLPGVKLEGSVQLGTVDTFGPAGGFTGLEGAMTITAGALS